MFIRHLLPRFPVVCSLADIHWRFCASSPEAGGVKYYDHDGSQKDVF